MLGVAIFMCQLLARSLGLTNFWLLSRQRVSLVLESKSAAGI